MRFSLSFTTVGCPFRLKQKQKKSKEAKMHQHVANAMDAVTFHFRFLSFNGTFMHDQINSNFLLFFTSNDSSLTFLWHYKFMIVTSLTVTTTKEKNAANKGKNILKN